MSTDGCRLREGMSALAPSRRRHVAPRLGRPAGRGRCGEGRAGNRAPLDFFLGAGERSLLCRLVDGDHMRILLFPLRFATGKFSPNTVVAPLTSEKRIRRNRFEVAGAESIQGGRELTEVTPVAPDCDEEMHSIAMRRVTSKFSCPEPPREVEVLEYLIAVGIEETRKTCRFDPSEGSVPRGNTSVPAEPDSIRLSPGSKFPAQRESDRSARGALKPWIATSLFEKAGGLEGIQRRLRERSDVA